MKTIIMQVPMAGDTFSWAPGESVQVEDALADALCASHDGAEPRAVLAHNDPPSAKRTATKPAGEKRG